MNVNLINKQPNFINFKNNWSSDVSFGRTIGRGRSGGSCDSPAHRLIQKQQSQINTLKAQNQQIKEAGLRIAEIAEVFLSTLKNLK